MFQPRLLSFIFSLILLCVTSLLSVPAQNVNQLFQPQGEQGRRIGPPDVLNCSRNELTSFTGRVLAYSRGNGRLYLRLRTDEETTESFTLRHSRRDNPAKWFLLRAEPFRAADWKLIESRFGRLRPGMRATVWVCSNNQKPLIDWQPPES